jgi:hypothetical protein
LARLVDAQVGTILQLSMSNCGKHPGIKKRIGTSSLFPENTATIIFGP